MDLPARWAFAAELYSLVVLPRQIFEIAAFLNQLFILPNRLLCMGVGTITTKNARKGVRGLYY